MSCVLSCFSKFRAFGVKGVVEHFADIPRRHRLRAFFCNNVRKHPHPSPQRGITIVAPITKNTSLSKVLRDLAYSLKNAGVPFQTFDLGNTNEVPADDCAGILTPSCDFELCRYTHLIELLGNTPLPPIPNVKRHRLVFWEFESGMLSMYPHLLDSSDAVIGMSDFNAQYFRKALPPETPVRKILYPLRMDFAPEDLPARGETRAKYNLRKGDFIVFFNFGLGSGRKNPEGCMRAFAKAFPDRKDTRLVFKTMYAKRFPNELSALKKLAIDLHIEDRFTTIDNYLPQKEIYALTNACDCYLSLHRGEGFGLGIAEAMSLGKPVIVTDYSSTTEFCSAENSLPIPAMLVPINPSSFDAQTYRGVDLWAEPDIDSAATALSRLYNSPEFRIRLGNCARASISRQFSTEHFRRSIDKFLSC